MEDIFQGQESRDWSEISSSLFIDLEHALLIWQTSYVWLMAQFNRIKNVCLSIHSHDKFFWNKVPWGKQKQDWLQLPVLGVQSLLAC